MTECYRIREWTERYEVDDKNRAYVPGKSGKFRAGVLPYVRYPVWARSLGPGYRRLTRRAGSETVLEGCMAVWQWLLQCASDNVAGRRGLILDDDGNPASIEYIEFCTGFAAATIRNALDILASPDVRWIEIVDEDASRKIRESPGIPGNSRLACARAESETESETEAYSESAESTGKLSADAAAAMSSLTRPPAAR